MASGHFQLTCHRRGDERGAAFLEQGDGALGRDAHGIQLARSLSQCARRSRAARLIGGTGKKTSKNPSG